MSFCLSVFIKFHHHYFIFRVTLLASLSLVPVMHRAPWQHPLTNTNAIRIALITLRLLEIESIRNNRRIKIEMNLKWMTQQI